MHFHISKKGKNRKLGNMPVSTSSKDTCPPSCPYYNNGCYASYGRLNLHWLKVSDKNRGIPWREFLEEVRSLPCGIVWRHNQAGDLAGNGNHIDFRMLKELVRANEGKKGYTYTHKPLNKHNIKAVQYANKHGFTINVSGTGLKEADKLKALNCAPVVTTLLSTETKSRVTPAGNRVILCPAISKGRKCIDCNLCKTSNRKAIVGFPAHGSGAKRVDAAIEEMDS